MQDSTSIFSCHENTDKNSQIIETDHEIRSKPTTARTEYQQKQQQQQKRVFSRLPSIRSDSTISPLTTRRDKRSHSFEPAVSDRESWWRVTIKDTPNPGTYDTHLNTFIKEIVARPMTYGFKSDGRRRDPQPLEPKGKELLPGAYSVEDFVERTNRLRLSYGFKGPQRQDVLKKSISANQDKDINVAPGLYETQKYQTINAPIEPARHSFFKSKTSRRIFLPKLGPAPGEYDPRTNVINVNSPTVTSSFKSRTDRFNKKSFNVPGPGTYDNITILPTSKQIGTFSTRGLFFNANFAHMASAAL